MININWDNVKPASENRLPAGGYIVQIKSSEDNAQKEYIKFEYDIVYGEYKGYFRELYDHVGFWGGRFIRSYKEKAQPFFKTMLVAFEGTNKNFKFSNDPSYFVNAYIGIVLSEEEYVGKDGSLKTRLYVSAFKTADDIKKGNFQVAKLKQLKGKTSDGFYPIGEDLEDDDLPF
ncbi:MAG: hypothetical protein LKJ75_02435 [Clostridia bacterium]|jgi:hypothetical protein|nr:hypothetical protein [Clostridia bacterium]MCI2014041.1 hypothetical protein [Clostridia bacterium]